MGEIYSNVYINNRSILDESPDSVLLLNHFIKTCLLQNAFVTAYITSPVLCSRRHKSSLIVLRGPILKDSMGKRKLCHWASAHPRVGRDSWSLANFVEEEKLGRHSSLWPFWGGGIKVSPLAIMLSPAMYWKAQEVSWGSWSLMVNQGRFTSSELIQHTLATVSAASYRHVKKYSLLTILEVRYPQVI